MNLLYANKVGHFNHELLQSRLPVVAEFFAPDCADSKLLTPFLENLAEKFAGRIKVLRVNVEEEPELAHQFHVYQLPTLVFFRDGQESDRYDGLISPYNLQLKLGLWAETNSRFEPLSR
jgi:thioredoxin 1